MQGHQQQQHLTSSQPLLQLPLLGPLMQQQQHHHQQQQQGQGKILMKSRPVPVVASASRVQQAQQGMLLYL
jgi:hypothetical protein